MLLPNMRSPSPSYSSKFWSNATSSMTVLLFPGWYQISGLNHFCAFTYILSPLWYFTFFIHYPIITHNRQSKNVYKMNVLETQNNSHLSLATNLGIKLWARQTFCHSIIPQLTLPIKYCNWLDYFKDPFQS